MPNLNELLTFDYTNEHVFEHDLLLKSNFSTPNIYSAKGDLNKRWYVYFSFRNPKTGKLQRMKNIYGKTNSYKTKEDRLLFLSAYRKKLMYLLNHGYNPFEDNVELHQKRIAEKDGQILLNEKKKTTSTSSSKNENSVAASLQKNENKVATMTITEAFEFALQIKKRIVNPKTYSGYSGRSNKFLDWVTKNQPVIKTIDQLTKNTLQQFLNSVLQLTSARNRNNYRADISSIIQVLVDNEILATNFIKNITVLKSTPERNKTYTQQTQIEIYKYLKEKDPILLLYIKFISYTFLRPIEVSRIKIKDINLKQQTISFKAKNKALKTKIIPSILMEDLKIIGNLNSEDYLFTPDKLGGQWDTTETNRRDYFTKRFKKVVKDHFNLDQDYGLYSFRHTYITKLYRELRKSLSPFEAKSNLMLITGHASMTALEKYLRDIDAELPKDYSSLLV